MKRAPTASDASGAAAGSLEHMDRLARLLDAQWRIPGTNIRFGIDPIVGLIPGLGDLAAATISGYIILQAKRNGAAPSVIARMVGNVAFDTIAGRVPVLGSIFDVFFKANKRNMQILLRDREARRNAELRAER